LFAVFIFLLLTIQYSNAVPHAKQTLKETLKKKMQHYYEKDAAYTSIHCVNGGWPQITLIAQIKTIRKTGCLS